MLWQKWFKEVGYYYISSIVQEGNIDFTIEQLYQKFKERLLDEIDLREMIENEIKGTIK